MGTIDMRGKPRHEPPGERSGVAEKAAAKAGPERPADMLAAEHERERQARWMVIGVSVALAVLVPIARQVLRWLRENRIRARVDREILRELGA